MVNVPRPFVLAQILKLTLSAAAISVAQPAGAQGVEVNEARLAEVVVSASKVGESAAQDTPISLSVVSAEQLERSVIVDVRDLVTIAPGLVIGENSGLAQVYIRGIGTNNVFAGGDPSTTVHLDGVYHARPQGTFNNFLDVERVEILRGPQGTLYGRNSVGGTINIISRLPSLTDGRSELQLIYGNENLRRLEAAFSGPLVENRVAGGIAAQFSQRDGYRENISTGGDLDDEDSQAARGQLRLAGSNGFEAILRADYFQNKSALYDFDTFLEFPTTPLTQQIFGRYDLVATDFANRHEQESWGTSAELNFELPADWKLKSLTAYRENDFLAAVDSDASELDLLRSIFAESQSQLSQEFNLFLRTDSLELLLGAYYLSEDIDMSETLGVQVRGAGIAVKPAPIVDTTTWSVFGQGTWHFSEQWSATLGGRYTDEEKEFDQNFGLFLLPDYVFLADLGFPKETGNYSKFTPKLGFEYRPSPDALLYASASRGFKSGGFSFTAPAPGGYKPESLWAYEVGFKSDLLDNRMQLNGSVFSYDYDDLQVLAFIVPGSIDVTNADAATIQGMELEVRAKATRSLELALGVSYLDAEYDVYPAAPAPGGVTVDAAGNRLNNAPEWMLQFGLDYRRAFTAWEFYTSANYGWQDEVFFTADNNDVDRQGSYGLVDAAIGIESLDRHWDISIWGRNLTDEEYITWSVQYTPPGRTGHAGLPLTYGLRASYRF